MLAKLSRPRSTTVAGYDLTFSPVKSVSTLWAVAEPKTAAQIEEAHHAAVADALRFLEQRALFSREGKGGVRQVDVRGLVAAAFTHRDSRAGDPDLHTHVAVANKVQTHSGKWLSIDGRVLFKAKVTASETYNTALEHHLTDRLGVQFGERRGQDPRKRRVREIVGVDPALNERWSARRKVIVVRQGELAGRFQQDHGRPPTPVEALQLAQQATLETRDAKHEPRSLAEQRATWHAEAVDVLGGGTQLRDMLHAALQPPRVAGPTVTAAWVAATSRQIVATVEEHRPTWQTWHLRAEALRQVRGTDLPLGQVERVVELLVDQAVQRCVPLTPPDDGLTEPAALRRADGSSVYTVAGADLYTSTRILTAEQRLISTAGHNDGWTVDPASVELALLETAANGVQLDAGQVSLVRSMVTSGSRLQLAIAPAGAGKTTALHTLTRAWTEAGGEVIGLAPSAVAAAQLGEQTGAPADTLAKLTWTLDHQQPLPDWAAGVGPRTLVLVDEAGMADTLTLDTAVAFIVERGGSVRLVGDDAQLSAIGAGGVLHDVQAVHGVVRLTELHRFADPIEAAVTLALRDGQPAALGFYLDRHRIHVGDPTTITEQVFTAWQVDRGQSLDALMLAPTRDQVADLNFRARTHRLRGTIPGWEVRLADGNLASVGDTVITRSNQRQLRTTADDWVKNGDRWTVQHVSAAGGLQVKHLRTGRTTALPAGYVHNSVELGYATTIHGAQGVTADTMHGVITGDASRQQLYTMLTRGRTANHVYLPVVGDGDPHTAIHPDTIYPRTATDLLEQILARDDTPTSASTLQRHQQDAALRLGDAADRYLDALHVAAEQVAGADTLTALDHTAEQVAAGLTHEPAWPTLRANLIFNSAEGVNPSEALRAAAATRELDTANDRAAVLDFRCESDSYAPGGPLPWLPAVPKGLSDDAEWGPYLKARSQLVTDLADRIRLDTAHRRPAWAADHPNLTANALVADVEVWRAANRVDGSDGRATGAPVTNGPGHTWQAQLERRLAADTTEGRAALLQLITDLAPSTAHDRQAPLVAARVASLVAAGLDGRQLLKQATGGGPLPDDHPASALWWRVVDQLPGSASQPQELTSPPRTSRRVAARPAARAASPQHRLTVSRPPWSPER
ncbi:MobF family relaxase [Friedmanniella luteola]|uniref:MobF family relaxase n=1 Tax=Friedmanniella luteola TaxID=546871 RepID=UPI000A43F36E|nr:MobF family relaxase [Friedmanniella luteola]